MPKRPGKPSRSSGTGRSGGGGPRARGSRDTKPARGGDRGAPHGRPGDKNRYGASRDRRAPHGLPADAQNGKGCKKSLCVAAVVLASGFFGTVAGTIALVKGVI